MNRSLVTAAAALMAVAGMAGHAAAQYADQLPQYYSRGGTAANAAYDGYYAGAQPTPADGGAAAEVPADFNGALSDGNHDGAGCCGASCGGCNVCCIPFWAHRTGVFFDLLFLRARGADVAYAQIRNGIDPATSVPFGPVAVASPDYQPGFRGGVNWAFDRFSSLNVGYTYYQSETNDAIATVAPLAIHSLLTHPNTASAAADSLVADARYDIRFQFADIALRRLLSGGANYAVNYSIGSRYAHLDETFSSNQPIGPGVTNVFSNIDFDGIGTRVGLEGERRLSRGRLRSYAKTFASVLIGEFDTDYQQFNNLQLTQATTSWEDGRAIAILDYELGVGWQSAGGNLRLSAGYYFAAWFNTITTDELIQAVRTSDFVDRDDTITFDGIVLRSEVLW